MAAQEPAKLTLGSSSQTVVITGGSQGMGRAAAKQLAAKGANVVIVARNVDKLKAALEYIAVSSIYISRLGFES